MARFPLTAGMTDEVSNGVRQEARQWFNLPVSQPIQMLLLHSLAHLHYSQSDVFIAVLRAHTYNSSAMHHEPECSADLSKVDHQ